MKLILNVLALALLVPVKAKHIRKTDERVTAHGYPMETHTAQTSDGYLLTLFRIPFSPRRQNQTHPAPVVLLIHGMWSSSDTWILSGPDNALPFLLADAGYDVWLGNNRGNTYSRENARIPRSSAKFWSYTWNEMGIFDLPAMIDYILLLTKQPALHFVGHSQGTTIFFVLLSINPSYNTKIKTSYMLGPAVFMNHMQSPLAKILGPYLGNGGLLSGLHECYQVFPNTELLAQLGLLLCSKGSALQNLCSNFILLAGGGLGSKNLNYTLVPDIGETHPADTSICLPIHYLQGYMSGHFRKFDFGKVKNKEIYNKKSPPDYPLGNITAPIMLFYGKSDLLVSSADVFRLKKLLHNDVRLYEIPIKGWNHFDFIWSRSVKQIVNNVIIKNLNEFEQVGEQ